MSIFTDDYTGLLIKQYWDKPKAFAEINAKAESWESIRDVLASFPAEFDIDASLIEPYFGVLEGFVLGLEGGFILGLSPTSAIGDRLDIIGKIVGLDRGGLTDELYRQLLKVKVAQNNASAFMVSDTRISIQDVIELAFNGEAYAVDNQNMSLTLFIESETITASFIQLMIDNKLLPKPQGVRYDIVASIGGGIPFGFSESGQPEPTDVLGFSELVYAPSDGGELAELYS